MPLVTEDSIEGLNESPLKTVKELWKKSEFIGPV